MADQYLFTTEGHVFPIRKELRSKIWETEEDFEKIGNFEKFPLKLKNHDAPPSNGTKNCLNLKRNEGGLPLHSDYLAQIFTQVGAEFS